VIDFALAPEAKESNKEIFKDDYDIFYKLCLQKKGL